LYELVILNAYYINHSCEMGKLRTVIVFSPFYLVIKLKLVKLKNTLF
jgi:hypothetical protein